MDRERKKITKLLTALEDGELTTDDALNSIESVLDEGDIADNILEEIKKIHGVLANGVSEPEKLSPLLSELISTVETLNSELSNKEIDLSPVQNSLSKLEKAVMGISFPDRTNELLKALTNLEQAVGYIKFETKDIDVSGIEKGLEPLSKISIEDGKVAVKLSDEDLDELIGAFEKGGKEGVKVYGSNVHAVNIKNALDVMVNPATEESLQSLSTKYALRLDETTTANVTYVGELLPIFMTKNCKSLKTSKTFSISNWKIIPKRTKTIIPMYLQCFA